MPIVRSRDKVVYKGELSFTLVTLNQTVTFPQPMPDTNYDIAWNVTGLNVNISIINKTVNGFTLSLAIGLSTTIKWWAVENVTT